MCTIRAKFAQDDLGTRKTAGKQVMQGLALVFVGDHTGD